VSCFARTPPLPLLSVRCAQEMPAPRGRSGPQEIPAPFTGNHFVPSVSARPDAWFGLPPLSDQASQSSSTQGARHGSFFRSRHRHSRENGEKYWWADRAPHEARKKAHECKMAGDIEGLHAWGKVAKVSEARRTVDPPVFPNPNDSRVRTLSGVRQYNEIFMANGREFNNIAQSLDALIDDPFRPIVGESHAKAS